mmetsp:Transcript_30389/g.65197  ORF Transcript_30389/g.65197 Transcript_30389/m.65197 type:complete len:542 (+) Transcript_30389:200-1825(+)
MDIVGHYYPANASAAATTKMESVLSATLTDLHVRGEVGSCIQSMLLDIETTHHLQQQLELEATHRLLEKAQTEQQGVILEAHAERLERYHRRVDVADHFVVELLQLNREMKELLAWKEAHEDKVRNYDSVMARLAQTEEELKEAQRVSYGGRARPRRAEGDAKPEEETTEPPNADREGAVAADGSETQAKAEPTIQSVPSEQHKAAAGTEAPETGADHETPMETDPTTGTCAEGVVDKNNDDDDDEQLLEDVQKPPAFEEPALVSIDAEADVEEDVPTLMTLDVEPLMNVFGFLDAMDILNTAQINLTMYNKVDNIFGISEDGQSPPVPTPSRSKAAAKPARSAGAPQSTNATTGATQATPATTSTGAATAAAATTTTIRFQFLSPPRPPSPYRSRCAHPLDCSCGAKRATSETFGIAREGERWPVAPSACTPRACWCLPLRPVSTTVPDFCATSAPTKPWRSTDAEREPQRPLLSLLPRHHRSPCRSPWHRYRRFLLPCRLLLLVLRSPNPNPNHKTRRVITRRRAVRLQNPATVEIARA